MKTEEFRSVIFKYFVVPGDYNEQHLLNITEDMPSLKPSLPFGQLPVLEVDGNTICQSMAIARYLVSECGIAGSSGLVKAQVDEVVDVINDVQNAMVSQNILG